MALIKRFCCGCNVRSGSIFSGFYSLVSSGLFVGLLCVRYVGYRLVDSSETYAIAAYATVALFMLLLATSVTLVIGVYMDIQVLFVPWLVIVVLCILEAAGALVWYIISRLRSDEAVPIWEIAITSFHVINSIILLYCVVCVISQLQDLMAGKGTSRYYRRRRQLRRQRLPPHITPIPIELLGEPGTEGCMPSPGEGPSIPPPPYIDQPPPYVLAGDQANEVVREGSGSPAFTVHPSGHPVNEESGVGFDGTDVNVRHMQRPDECPNGGGSPDTGSLHVAGNVNNGFEESNDVTGPSRYQQEPLPSFHFGDIDLALPIAADGATAHARDESHHRRPSFSPRNRAKKKKKKRKRNDRSRSNERGHARVPSPQRSHPAPGHGRRQEGQRLFVAPHHAPHPPPAPSISPSLRPFPPSPRSSRL